MGHDPEDPLPAIESAGGLSATGDGPGTKIDRWLALEAQNAGTAIEITPVQAAFLEHPRFVASVTSRAAHPARPSQPTRSSWAR